jgi:hypothetical protein
MARSSKGSGFQVVNLAIGVQFPYEPLLESKQSGYSFLLIEEDII